MNKLIGLITRIALGKEIALAVVLLKLITEAVRKRDVTNVAVFVFRKLPSEWRSPQGPASEEEFVALIQSGEAFLRNVHALTIK